MISRDTAESIIERFSSQTILVVGDLMLDRYVEGTVSRISPEAPVPVVRIRKERSQPGGAANVALNIQSLGGNAVVAGITGKDTASEDLLFLLKQKGIGTQGVIECSDLKTTVKTRVMAERQQIVRVDREQEVDPGSSHIDMLCKRIAELKMGVSGIIVEDYGKGVVCDRVAETAVGNPGESGVPVGYDPKENHALKIRGITVATPNYLEARSAAMPGTSFEQGEHGDLPAIGAILMDRWDVDLLLITLGADGMYMLPREGEASVIPTVAREVFDVSGAGDTVIAAALMSLAVGADYRDAAELANSAAGIVVGKVGTADCSRAELLSKFKQGI